MDAARVAQRRAHHRSCTLSSPCAVNRQTERRSSAYGRSAAAPASARARLDGEGAGAEPCCWSSVRITKSGASRSSMAAWHHERRVSGSCWRRGPGGPRTVNLGTSSASRGMSSASAEARMALKTRVAYLSLRGRAGCGGPERSREGALGLEDAPAPLKLKGVERSQRPLQLRPARLHPLEQSGGAQTPTLCCAAARLGLRHRAAARSAPNCCEGRARRTHPAYGHICSSESSAVSSGAAGLCGG